MFDIGWGELFLIGVVALIVVGPKDLPALFRTIGNFTGKARGMAREFQRSLEQAANESGMSEVSKSLRSIDETLNSATESARKFATQPVRSVLQPKDGEAVAQPHTPSTGAASTPASSPASTPVAGQPGTTPHSPPTQPAAEPAPMPEATPRPSAASDAADASTAAAEETRAARG